MEIVRQFKLSENAYTIEKKRILLTLIPLYLLLSIALVIYYFVITQGDSMLLFRIAFFVLLLLAMPLIIRRRLSKTRNALDVFTLTIGNDCVTRKIGNDCVTRKIGIAPTITLRYDEITEIIRRNDGSYQIKGRNKRESISIPIYIDNREDLETALNQIMPLSAKPLDFAAKYRNALLIATVSIMLAGIYFIFYGDNNWLALIFGVLILAIFAVHDILRLRNKNAERRSPLVFILSLITLVSIGLTIYCRFVG